MHMMRLPDGRWDVQLTVADVPCLTCWAGSGEPCVDKDGEALIVPTYRPRESKENYRVGSPPYHRSRWECAVRRGVTPGQQSIQPVREAVRNSTRRRPAYGRLWNPWPEDYGEYKEEWK